MVNSKIIAENVALHGGKLVIIDALVGEREELVRQVHSTFGRILGEEDYIQVVKQMRLANGLSIPIMQSVSREEVSAFKEGIDVALSGKRHHLLICGRNLLT